MIAARTHLFASTIPREHWISYEELLLDCDRILNELIEPFGLAPFRFEEHLQRDHNVSGSPSEGPDLWRSFFDARQLERLAPIFAPLEALRAAGTGRSSATAEVGTERLAPVRS